METKNPTIPPPTALATLIRLDTAVSLHLYTFFNPVLPFSLLKCLEFSGDGRVFFPITLSILIFNRSSNLLLLNLLIGSILDLLLIGLIKHLVQRPRPVYNKNMFLSFAVDHWSFPSGHSSRVSFIATFCYLYSDQIAVKHLNLMVGLWAAITSVSRVLLGRHFLLDVIAGALLGVLEGILVLRVFNVDNFSFWFR